MTNTIVSEKDLDTAIEDVNRLKGEAVAAFWRLGKKLAEIDGKQLWKLRLTSGGKARYKSFNAFVREELKMNAGHAHELIQVALQYTEADAAKLGASKAARILRAPEEARPALIEAAKNGASYRQTRTAVNEARALLGSPKTGQHAEAGKRSAEVRKVKKSASQATHAQDEVLADVPTAAVPRMPLSRKKRRGIAFLILETEVAAEGWARNASAEPRSRFDALWDAATVEERHALIKALQASRTAAARMLERLRGSATDFSGNDSFRIDAGRHNVPLYRLPASLRDVIYEELPRAASIEDKPFGRLELEPGGWLYLSLRAKDGDLYAVVEVRKQGDA